MSTIPNSAMPHAIEHEPDAAEPGTDDAVGKAKLALGGLVKDVEDFAREVGDRIKGAPKGAQIAAGAAVVGGLVAAAAIPLVRAARKPAPTAKPKRAASSAQRTTRARKPKSGGAA